VDEANIRAFKVAFTAPIVQAMMGKGVDDAFEFVQGEKKSTFKIVKLK
jgi:transcription elongation GreA/GreB family factor